MLNRGLDLDSITKTGAHKREIAHILREIPYIFNIFSELRKENLDFDSNLRTIEEEMDKINGNLIIVGHSLGGLHARSYTQKNPSRVKSCITITTPHNGTPTAYLGILLKLFGM